LKLEVFFFAIYDQKAERLNSIFKYRYKHLKHFQKEGEQFSEMSATSKI